MTDSNETTTPEAAAEISRVGVDPLVSRGAGTNKVQLHTDSNAAYSVLMKIANQLDCPIFYQKLERQRAFLSDRVDQSGFPPC